MPADSCHQSGKQTHCETKGWPKHQGTICPARSALLPLGHLAGGNLSNLQHCLGLFP